MKCLFVAIFCLMASGFVSAEEKIDVNAAPLEDLIKIIYIGEVRAKELISLRPFSSLDDLARIKGIGEKSIEAIKKQGLAWVGPKPQTETPESATIQKPTDAASLLRRIDGSPLISSEDEPSTSSVKPDPTENLPLGEDKYNNAALIFAAAFTSFSGGVIILILKKKLELS